MGMFDNYNNQNTDYIPNNLGYACRKPMAYPIPYVEYNTEGEQSGYYWYYGDTVNLVFELTGEVTVEGDSILYFISGEEPSEDTEGEIGQKAYNLNDLISWTCVGIIDDGIITYVWNKDDEFIYPETGEKGVYIPASKYINGMTAIAKIYNFRFEEVYSEEFDASNEITLSIGRELSEKLIKGTYYITLTLVDKTVQNYIPIFRDKECVITVK